MSHMKRHKSPKNWPIARKGTMFVVKPSSGKGIPLLIVLRDLLKLAKNRKEVKKAIHENKILLNNQKVKSEKTALTLFDTLSILPLNKHYKLTLSEKGKFQMEEIDKKEANTKFAKIINKRILKGKKTQINLSDGRNFLSEIKCNTNDSVLINFENKKIEKCISLNEKSKAVVFAGKHAGETGKIESFDSSKKIAVVDDGKNKINVLIKQLMAIE